MRHARQLLASNPAIGDHISSDSILNGANVAAWQTGYDLRTSSAENMLSILVRFVFTLFILAGLVSQAPGEDGKPVLEKKLSDGAANNLFRRENLVAWCIVPFDA